MKRLIVSVVCILLIIVAAVFSLSKCGADETAGAVDLMSGVTARAVDTDEAITRDDTATVADFAVRLYQSCVAGSENSLISPVSVLYALAMTANGADGETLRQMENTLGLTTAELNAFLHAYMNAQPAGEEAKLRLANSIWFKDDPSFEAYPEFLQLNADYYGATLYKAAFDDTTLKAINDWVSTKTDGMVKDILDQIPELAVMYLINALAFDAEWSEAYNDYQLRDEIFTAETGKKQIVKLMNSIERLYLDDGSATGFIKHYDGGRYAFAALLPNEGISVSEYIASLDGETLIDTLQNAQSVTVSAAMPKFESGQALEMSEILTGMGMRDLFDDELANLTRLGHSDIGNLFVSRVIHKTYIAVNERGTKAGAATVVEVMVSGAPRQEDTKTVILDRSFIYMIIDCESYLPVFIGAVMEL